MSEIKRRDGSLPPLDYNPEHDCRLALRPAWSSRIRDPSRTGTMSPAPRPSHDASQAPLPPRDGAGITEDEAALYDRQLRLWGVEAQNRMRQSRVLLAGSFRGISTEVAKNIVLAGVGKVSLLDDSKVEWRDLGSGYWQREEDIGQFVRYLSSLFRSVGIHLTLLSSR